MGYLSNFIVYTLAMVGVMLLALFVFKNATSCGKSGGTKHMKVLDTLSLGPRKTLYIVSAGNEKFLIAGDVDKTTLISKLESCEENISAVVETENTNFATKATPAKSIYMDKSIVGIRSTQNIGVNTARHDNSSGSGKTVWRSMLEEIGTGREFK